MTVVISSCAICTAFVYFHAVCINLCISNCSTQISSCPDSTQATSLDISKAYRNSPILPEHKHYLLIIWRDSVYVQHVAIEGLAMARGIQGSLADACVLILKHQGIGPAVSG